MEKDFGSRLCGLRSLYIYVYMYVTMYIRPTLQSNTCSEQGAILFSFEGERG